MFHIMGDCAGRGAAKALQAILSGRYEVADEPTTQGKDFNDMLCLQLGLVKKKTKASEPKR